MLMRVAPPTGTYGPRLLAVTVLAAYVAFAAAYLRNTPLFEGPDEPSHLQYVGFVALQGALPSYGEQPDVPGEGMQPPLYYMMAAPFFSRLAGAEATTLVEELRRANLTIYGYDRRAILTNQLLRPGVADGTNDARQFATDERLLPLARLRWLSIAFGVLALVLTREAVRRATADANLGTLAAAALALNPQFLFVSGLVSNDTAATMVGALSFFVFAGALPRPSRRHYVLLGLTGALGLAVKLSTLPVVATAAAFVFFLDPRVLRERLANALWAAAAALVAIAPLLFWNTKHRGDPLGTSALAQSWGHLPTPEVHGGLWAYFTEMYVPWTLGSYVARFGWMTIEAPWGVYAAAAVLGALGGGGFLWACARRNEGTAPRAATPLLAYLAAVILVTLAAHVWLNIQTAQPQGRHFFPVAAQISAALALGWRHLSTRLASIGTPTTAALTVPLGLLALYCLVAVLQPNYP